MAKPKVNKTPELKVVFDTSAIYATVSNQLINGDVSKLIKENSSHTDLNIYWYLPFLVVREREYQMIKKGSEFLPTIERLERLLGHNLAITQELIESRVRSTIQAQIKEHNMNILDLHINEVDWSALISHSVSRQPPFDPGDKEKGFRDKIILETFLQLVRSSPTTARICRVALVSGDSLLREAAERDTSGSANVRILSSVEDLKSLINTLVGEIDEAFVSELQDVAQKYFFEKDNNDTFYYSQKIRDELKERFGGELATLPPGADYRRNGTWYISKPRFVKKEKQRVKWVTQINVEGTAYKKYSGQVTTEDIVNQIVYGSSAVGNLLSQTVAGAGEKGSQPDLIVANGKTPLNVTWSVSVTTSRKFSKPKVELFSAGETTWDE